MKKIIAIAFLLVAFTRGFSQTQQTFDTVNARQKIKLGAYGVSAFDNDTSLAAISAARLPTQYAIYEYIQNHVIAALTSNGIDAAIAINGNILANRTVNGNGHNLTFLGVDVSDTISRNYWKVIIDNANNYVNNSTTATFNNSGGTYFNSSAAFNFTAYPISLAKSTVTLSTSGGYTTLGANGSYTGHSVSLPDNNVNDSVAYLDNLRKYIASMFYSFVDTAASVAAMEAYPYAATTIFLNSSNPYQNGLFHYSAIKPSFGIDYGISFPATGKGNAGGAWVRVGATKKNIWFYGAIPDFDSTTNTWITDNSVPVQLAANSNAFKQSFVYIPAGAYGFNSSDTLLYGTVIEGDGMGLTHLYWYNSTNAFVTCQTATPSRAFYIRLKDLKIIGNYGSTTTSAFLSIKNTLSTNPRQDPGLIYCYDVEVDSFNVGFNYASTSDGTYNINCIANSCNFGAIGGAPGSIFTGGDYNNNKVGILVQGIDDYLSGNMQIECDSGKNYIGVEGIYNTGTYAGSPTNTPNQCIISGVNFQVPKPIRFTSGSSVTIDNCTFYFVSDTMICAKDVIDLKLTKNDFRAATTIASTTPVVWIDSCTSVIADMNSFLYPSISQREAAFTVDASTNVSIAPHNMFYVTPGMTYATDAIEFRNGTTLLNDTMRSQIIMVRDSLYKSSETFVNYGGTKNNPHAVTAGTIIGYLDTKVATSSTGMSGSNSSIQIIEDSTASGSATTSSFLISGTGANSTTKTNFLKIANDASLVQSTVTNNAQLNLNGSTTSKYAIYYPSGSTPSVQVSGGQFYAAGFEDYSDGTIFHQPVTTSKGITYTTGAIPYVSSSNTVSFTAAGTSTQQALFSGGSGAGSWQYAQIIGSIAAGGTSGTFTQTMTGGDCVVVTPTGNMTVNAASGSVIGQRVSFLVTTSGTTSYTITWGTNMLSPTTLSTGTVSGKNYRIEFEWSGSNWFSGYAQGPM